MPFEFPLARKNYVIFAGLVISMIAAVLVWVFSLRLASFEQHQYDSAHEALAGVQNRVAFYIAEKRRMVDLFVHENISLISSFAKSPDNDELHKSLDKKLSLYFPDRFSFTIADRAGSPLFEDFDGLVSELCLADLRKFATAKQSNHPYIHPNAEGYHFDIMVRYAQTGERGIFFVSFHADLLGDIIKSFQGPYQKILLIKSEQNDLIEVIADGARNHLVREDYRLTEEERSQIDLRMDIPGTQWQAIAFRNESLYKDFIARLVIQLGLVFAIFLTITILFVIRLRHEEQQREKSEEQRRALLGVVGHEFRSPTSIIKSSLETIQSGILGEVKGDIKEFIDMALGGTTRLSLLVDEFLEMESIESGNLQLNLQKTQLSVLVSEVVINSQLQAEKFGSSYRLHEPLQDDYVNCDETRIQQIMINMLSNAVKYGDENTVVDVAMSKHDKWLRVSVMNNGPGIPLEFQDRVFEKFALIHAPKKQQPIKSPGLGLSIAKEIIEMHGGRIGFASEPDKLTVFWFELKVAD